MISCPAALLTALNERYPMSDAYIYDTVRSPRGKGRKDGSLHEVTAVRLSAQILNALKNRNNLQATPLRRDLGQRHPSQRASAVWPARRSGL